jgi:hypothetical protein
MRVLSLLGGHVQGNRRTTRHVLGVREYEGDPVHQFFVSAPKEQRALAVQAGSDLPYGGFMNVRPCHGNDSPSSCSVKWLRARTRLRPFPGEHGSKSKRPPTSG